MKLNIEKQNYKMKSFHRNFYSKLDNFTKTDVLYQYNNMIYKGLSDKEDDNNENNYIKKNKIYNGESQLSSIKIGNTAYHCNKSLWNIYNKESKYKNRECMLSFYRNINLLFIYNK